MSRLTLMFWLTLTLRLTLVLRLTFWFALTLRLALTLALWLAPALRLAWALWLTLVRVVLWTARPAAAAERGARTTSNTASAARVTRKRRGKLRWVMTDLLFSCPARARP